MKYEVIVQPRAERDIESIVERIAENNETAAVLWYERIVEAMQTLVEFPKRCPRAPENGLVPTEIRQLLHGRRRGMYRILFTIKGDTVHVLHIRHSARDWVDPGKLDLP